MSELQIIADRAIKILLSEIVFMAILFCGFKIFNINFEEHGERKFKEAEKNLFFRN